MFESKEKKLEYDGDENTAQKTRQAPKFNISKFLAHGLGAEDSQKVSQGLDYL